jgi:hypothetical protein
MEALHRRHPSQPVLASPWVLGSAFASQAGSTNDQRKAAGLALVLIGGLAAIPLTLRVIGKQSAQEIKQAA